MSAPSSPAPPRGSIVIAVLDEEANIPAVCAELAAVFARDGSFEVVFVDDGSSDGTAAAIAREQAENPSLRLLRHDRRCGKTAALRTGVSAARGVWVATMDGDGQNDPADLLPMFALAFAATGPAPLVAGIRTRRDDPLSRRIATRIANGFRRAILADACPDTGCGMKVFRRDDYLRLPAFEGQHRFLPALFALYGHPLICYPVRHRARHAGRSKYTNFGRALVGLADLAGVLWLRARTHLPGTVHEERPQQ